MLREGRPGGPSYEGRLLLWNLSSVVVLKGLRLWVAGGRLGKAVSGLRLRLRPGTRATAVQKRLAPLGAATAVWQWMTDAGDQVGVCFRLAKIRSVALPSP